MTKYEKIEFTAFSIVVVGLALWTMIEIIL